MRPPIKLGKHVEDPISEHCCLDRISSLPDELLGHLLSFLPTRCAVRTSTLSTRWRYLFTLTTSLSFDDTPCFDRHANRNEIIEATRRFKFFVDKVLELHQISPIKKFSLLCKFTNDNSAFNRWVSFAVQKGVQELHYKLPGQYYRLIVPFSNLKILNLDRIIFIDFTSMERLFSSCELLEEFTLKCCHTYDGFHASEDSAEYDRELLKAAASKATKISFETDSRKALHLLGDEEQTMPDFYRLSRLELDDCPYDSWKYVTSLIDKSPQLETVIFGMGFHCVLCSPGRYNYLARCTSDYQPPSPPDIPLEVLVTFSCHAQVIEVHDFCGHKNSLSLMGHLLRNASVLKRLVVFTICNFNLNPEEELKIIKDLLMLPRASLDCRLEINKVDKNVVPNFHCMSYVEAP